MTRSPLNLPRSPSYVRASCRSSFRYPEASPQWGATVSLYDIRTSRSRGTSLQWRESLGPSQTSNALGRVSIAPLGGQPSGQAFAEAYSTAGDRGYFGMAPLSHVKNNALHIVLEKQGLLAGRVLRDGQPWPGVRVSIGESRRQTNPDGSATGGYTTSNHRQATTDAQGVYRLALPARKDYNVSIQSLPDGSQTPSVGRTAHVIATQKTLVKDFNIVAGSEQIAGVVTDAAGNPVAGVRVQISSSKSSFWHRHRENSQPETNASGRFVLRNIPAGTHDLLVFGPRRDGASRTYTRLAAQAGKRDLRIVIDSRPVPALPRLVPQEIRDL